MLSADQFDSHDDRDDDPEGESVEEHKSVIMHLLSQVRLGMDLTKVTTSAKDSHLQTGALVILDAGLTPPVGLEFTVVSASGGPANVYSGEKVAFGDVCRFLCTPGFVCQVCWTVNTGVPKLWVTAQNES